MYNRCVVHVYDFSHLISIVDISEQVLSMSRLGGAGAVAQLVADVPLSAVEVVNLVNFKNFII